MVIWFWQVSHFTPTKQHLRRRNVMKRHTNKALVSLALIVSMLLSLLPNLPQATATDLTAAPTQEAAVLPEKSPVYQLDASCKLLSYVDEAVFAEGNHIARLPSEETLSTYAFLNSDGTKTVYYMNEPVKFIDSDGKVVEKDIALTAAAGGYTTTRNDIQLTIPSNPTSGIRLTYGGKYVTLIPEGGTLSTAPQATDNSVTYPNYFGTGMSLVYTPTLSGVKEDIVLQSYTGVNSFTFTLNTNGLNMYQSNGRYYLAEGKTATRRYELGDVVAFDARGRFSVGTMTVTTVMPGQAYRITITTDEDFLTDPETVYPVAIDPTITVSDNTHGAGAIEDTTIYQGRPNANGNWTYLHCGYYSSTYTVARTLFRLTGLTSDSTYQTLDANKILSAQFHVREATGSAALDIKLLANTGSAAWTESGATWNNAGVVLGTEYARVSAKSNSDTVFDITSLVRAWKVGSENSLKGFVLVSTNESTLDKSFYASEYGTESYRPYVVVNYDTSSGPVLADGVYRIISKSANKPIGADRSIANRTNVATQATYTQYSEPFYQLWRITHLVGGLYSIRPLHKLSMGLNVTNTNIDICEIGSVDAISQVPESARWLIENTANGYTFKQSGNQSATMMAATTGTAAGINISVGTYSASSAQCHFTLSLVSPAPGALMLFSTSTDTLYVSSFATTQPAVYTELGVTKTLEQVGFVLSVCDAYDSSQTVQWSSTNPAVATVDSSTGTITALSTGETIIRASRTINGAQCSVAYKLVVIIPEGTYFIKNKGTDRYVDVSSQTVTHGTAVYQEYYDIDTTREWVFTSLGDGTYTIHIANLSSNYYLGVSGQNIVIKTGTVTNDMKWRIISTANSAFKLTPVSEEASGLVLAGYDTANMLLLQSYVGDYYYEDEWYICSLIDIGVSTDDCTSTLCHKRLHSAEYANNFATVLLNPTDSVPMSWEHHYNKDSHETASRSDFAVNGAMSAEIDFMIYMGHGHAAHNSLGNHIHYDCARFGNIHVEENDTYTVCAAAGNVYTEEMRFGSSTSDLRWVWMYTCNFLTTGQYVTEYSLMEMMNGVHIVMGYASQSKLCRANAVKFAEYLRNGDAIIDAFFKAGHDGESTATPDHHMQKVLYIPQASTETIYSIPINYEYTPSDVLIVTHDIQEPY